MAHEVETAMFTKTPAWHQLGVVLDEAPDIFKAFQCSGLNWNVDKMQLGIPAQPEVKIEKFALQRNSDKRILGYSGIDYTPWQNAEAFKWVEPLINSHLWKIDAAGSLKQGEVCWILLKQHGYQIVPGDTLKEYLLLNWAHNGLFANIIQPTSIRVVCNNTLQASLSGDNKIKIRHTQAIFDKMEVVQQLFKESEQSFEEQNSKFQMLLDKVMTDAMLEEFCDKYMPIPEKVGRGQTIAKKNNELIKTMVFGAASGHKELGIKNSAYGLFQAISEANEHYLVKEKTDKGMNILFGKGFANNQQLFKDVMELVA